MALGSDIIVSSNPKGVFLEGVVSGTPKPGTMMQIQAGTAAVAGRQTWEVYNPSGATGDPRLVAILLEDNLQGKGSGDAYVSGTRCFLYVPLYGEEMNILVKGQPGTGSANAFTVGERLEAEKGSGKFIQQVTSASLSQFTCLEHIDEVPNTDTLVWCLRAQ
jgi:hypothetical protein